MLTAESLKGIPALSTLTDEQIGAIATASANDENAIISAKTRTIYDNLDRDVAQITGVQKPAGIKSYEFLKNQLSILKTKAESAAGADDLKSQIETLQAEKTDLEKKAKSGSKDEVLKGQIAALEQKVADKENELQQVKTTFEAEKAQLNETLKAEQGKLVGLQVDKSIDSFLLEKGVKFKDSIPDNIRTTFMQNAKAELTQMNTPDFIDDGNGGQKMVFRDANGEILWNKETGSHFTAGELYLSKITDLVDNGKVQTGTGATGQQPTGGSTLDLSSAKTQMDATAAISDYLMTNEGLAKTSPKFSERQAELYDENKVSDLPIR